MLSLYVLVRAPLIPRLVTADNRSVRPTPKAAEAKGANRMGVVVVLMCFLPVGVLVSLDLLKLVKWVKHRDKPRPRRPKRKKRVSTV